MTTISNVKSASRTTEPACLSHPPLEGEEITRTQRKRRPLCTQSGFPLNLSTAEEEEQRRSVSSAVNQQLLKPRATQGPALEFIFKQAMVPLPPLPRNKEEKAGGGVRGEKK